MGGMAILLMAGGVHLYNIGQKEVALFCIFSVFALAFGLRSLGVILDDIEGNKKTAEYLLRRKK